LATSPLASRIQDWQVLPDLGSDHFGILFTIASIPNASNLVENPTSHSRYNTALANWELFSTTLQNQEYPQINSLANLEVPNNTHSITLLQNQDPALVHLLDCTAQELTTAIQIATTTSIPHSTPSARAKPW
jgi:hypothetical protein